MDARGVDGAEDGDRLAAEFGHGDGDDRSLEVFLEAGGESGFELVHGKASGLEAAGERHVDIAAHIEAERGSANLVGIEHMDYDLVVRAKDVRGGQRRCLGEGNRGEEEQQDFQDITFSAASRSETLVSSSWTRPASCVSSAAKSCCGRGDPVIMCCKA